MDTLGEYVASLITLYVGILTLFLLDNLSDYRPRWCQPHFSKQLSAHKGGHPPRAGGRQGII